jgi:hypothetical protein
VHYEPSEAIEVRRSGKIEANNKWALLKKSGFAKQP